MLSICEECVTHHWLKNEIQSSKEIIELCHACKSENVRTMPLSNEMLRNKFRLLIRLNLSEWQYNPSAGGMRLEELLRTEFYLIGLSRKFMHGNLVNFAAEVDDQTFVNPLEIIPIRNHGKSPFLSLKAKGDAEIISLSKECLEKNHYQLSNRAKLIIDRVKPFIARTIQNGSEYYRARIGHKLVESGPPFSFGRVASKLYVGYSGIDILPPPVNIASEGRLNRNKVSILYAASDPQTALCEVRPYRNQTVSIAKFIVQRDVVSANFATPPANSFLGKDGIEHLGTVTAISDLLSKPVPPDKRELYLISQLISDAVRDSGFDALEYSSSVANGNNIVFFKDSDYEFLKGSEWVELVEEIKYQSTKMLEFNEKNILKYHFE